MHGGRSPHLQLTAKTQSITRASWHFSAEGHFHLHITAPNKHPVHPIPPHHWPSPTKYTAAFSPNATFSAACKNQYLYFRGSSSHIEPSSTPASFISLLAFTLSPLPLLRTCLQSVQRLSTFFFSILNKTGTRTLQINWASSLPQFNVCQNQRSACCASWTRRIISADSMFQESMWRLAWVTSRWPIILCVYLLKVATCC